jgi:outer membrane usher protein FimD/PapC
MFKTEGIKSGDKVRGALIAEEVGTAAPPNAKVLETTLDLEEDTEDGEFSFSKPNKGWPVGKYRVEIYVNDKLAETMKFTVKAGKSETESKKSE